MSSFPPSSKQLRRGSADLVSAKSFATSILERSRPSDLHVVLASEVVAAEERIRPGARPRERVVLHHDRAVEHGLLFAARLQPLVGLRPDALSVVDLAEAVAGTAAGSVSLVLGALRLGAHVRDLGQRA